MKNIFLQIIKKKMLSIGPLHTHEIFTNTVPRGLFPILGHLLLSVYYFDLNS